MTSFITELRVYFMHPYYYLGSISSLYVFSCLLSPHVIRPPKIKLNNISGVRARVQIYYFCQYSVSN